jgi:diguanylate cyclase (GGDEF)-like protein
MRWLAKIRAHRGINAAASLEQRAVHQAGVLFIGAGAIGLITDLLPGIGNGDKLLDALVLALGLAALTPLSTRLAGYRSLVLPLVGMAAIAVNNTQGTLPAPTLGIWFVLIFLWIGSWHPRGTSLAMTPFAVAAYLLPYLAGAPRTDGSVGSVVLIIPVAVLAGEVIATNAQRTRELARDQQHAVDALAQANLTDDLTRLGNRRRGNQLLDAVQPGDAVAILDLDHFKAVNDQLGHARGDQVLQELGDYLRSVVRSSDEVARMGGEEFMLIIRDPHAPQVHAAVERLVAGWRACSPLSTLSAGVAIHDSTRAPTDTYRAADRALYEAKANGRDRTEVEPVDSPSATPVPTPQRAHERTS